MIQDRHEAVSGASGNLVHRASVVKQSRAGGRVQHRRDLGVWWRNKERDGVPGTVTAKVGRKVKGGRQRDWTKLLDTYLHQQRVRQKDDGCARAPRVFWCALTRTQSVPGSKAGREEPRQDSHQELSTARVRGLWNQDEWPAIKKSNNGTDSLRNGGGRKDAVGPRELPRRDGRIR